MSRFKRLVRWFLVLAALGVIGSILLPLALTWLSNRATTLPEPGGPYPVGRVDYDWVDTKRSDSLAPLPVTPRELVVWIWYPAAPAPGAVPASYLPANWAHAQRSDRGVGAMLFQNPSAVQTHAWEDAPMAMGASRYPVLVLAPGLGPLLSDYTTLAESLASHGYVVAGYTPTYSASVVVFPDGRAAYASPEGNVPDTASYAESQALLAPVIQEWTADAQFVLDQIQALEAADPTGRFTHRLDLQAVGMFGHSFGGATAAQACANDPRFKACANLDGYLFGEVQNTGLRQPFLFFWSEEAGFQGSPAENTARSVYSRLPGSGYWLTLRGAKHFNFSDYAVLYNPALRLLGGLGSLNGRRGLEITAAYLRAFFDQALKNLPSPLLDGPSPSYPEVIFEARP